MTAPDHDAKPPLHSCKAGAVHTGQFTCFRLSLLAGIAIAKGCVRDCRGTAVEEASMMRPRELFGVGVRILAVWFWTQAAYWGYWAAVKSAGTGLGAPSISAREDLAYMILYMLLGIALMIGARALVWLAYGDAPERDGGAPSIDTGTSGLAGKAAK